MTRAPYRISLLFIMACGVSCQPATQEQPSTVETSEKSQPMPPLRPQPTAEFSRWNVPDRDGLAIMDNITGERLEKDPFRYDQSQPSLPPLDLLEAREAKEVLGLELQDLWKAHGFGEFDEFGRPYLRAESYGVLGEQYGLFDPIDRTLQIPLIDPRLFSAKVLTAFQNTLQKKFPLWRVQVCGTTSQQEPSVMVYPDAVCVLNRQSPPELPEILICEWQEAIDRIREPSVGSLRRQLRYALKLVPQKIVELPEEGAIPLAVFGSKDQQPGHLVWILRSAMKGGLRYKNPEEVNIRRVKNVYISHEGQVLPSGKVGPAFFELFVDKVISPQGQFSIIRKRDENEIVIDFSTLPVLDDLDFR